MIALCNLRGWWYVCIYWGWVNAGPVRQVFVSSAHWKQNQELLLNSARTPNRKNNSYIAQWKGSVQVLWEQLEKKTKLFRLKKQNDSSIKKQFNFLPTGSTNLLLILTASILRCLKLSSFNVSVDGCSFSPNMASWIIVLICLDACISVLLSWGVGRNYWEAVCFFWVVPAAFRSSCDSFQVTAERTSICFWEKFIIHNRKLHQTNTLHSTPVCGWTVEAVVTGMFKVFAKALSLFEDCFTLSLSMRASSWSFFTMKHVHYITGI